MKFNDNDSLEQRREEYLEKRRKESVKKIITDYSYHFEENSLNLRIIISPKNYSPTEDLVPRPYAFEDFFNKLKKGELQGENCDRIYQFFDREAFTINNYDYENPNIIEKWFTISNNDSFPNSMIIKPDGVIYYNYHQNVQQSGKVIIHIEQLNDYLKTLFQCITPKIYEQMEYESNLKLDVNFFNLSDCYEKETESSDNLKLATIPLELHEKSYKLKFEELGVAHEKIITDIKRLFA